jgi:hypothetical protein
MKRRNRQPKPKQSQEEPDTIDKIEKVASAAVTVYRTIKPLAKAIVKRRKK